MADYTRYTEKWGNSGPKSTYLVHENTYEHITERSPKPVFKKLNSVLRELFLPYGYPDSVSDDYVEYQIWDTLQAFCSTITGILTTQAVMKGVGVGDELSSPLSAAITWILKDGVGMIGRITFAWWKGAFLDFDFKKWRLVADVLNDCALGLELTLFQYPEYSTKVLCISSSMKAIVGVAGGATRAAITQHQAVRGNMADVSAKDGSQETCVNLLASVIGLLLLANVDTNRFLWPIFLMLTAVHVFANYKAVRSVVMKTVNAARYQELLDLYLNTDLVAGPKLINQEEAVILGCGLKDIDICGHTIIMGSTIKNVLKTSSFNKSIFRMLVNIYERRRYMVVLNQESKNIYVIIHRKAEPEDVIKSYFHAVIIGVMAKSVQNQKLPLSRIMKYLRKEAVEIFGEEQPQLSLIRCAINVVDLEYKKFVHEAENLGWDMTNHNLAVDEWRAEW